MDQRVKLIYTTALSRRPEINVGASIYDLTLIERQAYMQDFLEYLKSRAYTQSFLRDRWCVYILELKDGSFYTGITNNLENRLEVHRSGRGSKYVRSRLPFIVIYVELVNNRSIASSIEYHIKQLNKSQKHRVRIAAKTGTVLLSCECGLLFRIKENEHIARAIMCPSCDSKIDSMIDRTEYEQ